MWLDVKDKWLLTCHFAVTNLDFLISVSGQGKWLHSLSHEMRSLMCSFNYLQIWDGIRYLYSACELTVEKLNSYVTSIPLYFPTSDKAVGQILLQSCAFSSKDIQFCFFFKCLGAKFALLFQIKLALCPGTAQLFFYRRLVFWWHIKRFF